MYLSSPGRAGPPSSREGAAILVGKSHNLRHFRRPGGPVHEKEQQLRAAGPVICGISENRAAQLPRGSADSKAQSRIFTALLKPRLPRTREGTPSPASRTDYLRHLQKPASPEGERECQLHTPGPIIYNTCESQGIQTPVNNRSESANLTLPLALWATRLLELP